MNLTVLERLIEELEAGRPAVLVSVRSFQGSVPRKDYPRALFLDAGVQVGTVGGGCVDGFARQLATEVSHKGGTLQAAQELDNDDAEASGLVCGGRLELEAQRFEATPESLTAARALLEDPALTQPRLLIFGGGHVGLATARFCSQVGFSVSVLDDREQYSNPDRFPFAQRCLVGPVDTGGEWLPATKDDAIVVATRGHQHDLEAMLWAARTHVGFIGLLGSIRKRQMILDNLASQGIPIDELVPRFHSPVGLDIGAVTADEIGLATAAQLVAFRRKTQEVVQEPSRIR